MIDSFLHNMTRSPVGVSCTQLHIDGNFKPLNVNSLFFYNHNTFLTPHYINTIYITTNPFPSHMDSQLSPEDHNIFDEGTGTQDGYSTQGICAQHKLALKVRKKPKCDLIYRNRSKSHIGSYEIIDFKDFNTL